MFSIDSGHELGLPRGFRPEDFLGCAHGDMALEAALSGDYSALDALPEPEGDGEMVA
jgi:hypothetical protein